MSKDKKFHIPIHTHLPYFVFYRIVFSITCAIIVSFLGVGLAMVHFTKMSIIFMLLTKIVIILQSFVYLSPLVLFLIVYGDVTAQLVIWSSCIQENITLGLKDTFTNMKNLKQFIQALCDITDLFSYFLFWIMNLSLIGLFFSAYKSITFILGSYLITLEYVFLSLRDIEFTPNFKKRE